MRTSQDKTRISATWRHLLTSVTAAVGLLGVTATNAFPALGLAPTDPSIGSAFISVTYTVNAGQGNLNAEGQAQ